MRARTKANAGEALSSSYLLSDGVFAAAGSSSSHFGYDVADFRWLDLQYARSLDLTTAVADAGGSTAGDRVGLASANAPELEPVSLGKALGEQTMLADAGIFAQESALLSYAASGEASSTYVPFEAGFIDFSIYPEFEPANSLLSIVNEGPLAALNQGDMVYYLDQGIGASFVRYVTPDGGGLLGTHDPFNPLTYVVGDTDGDGVIDYVIRMDENGPTLMGTDYII